MFLWSGGSTTQGVREKEVKKALRPINTAISKVNQSTRWRLCAINPTDYKKIKDI